MPHISSDAYSPPTPDLLLLARSFSPRAGFVVDGSGSRDRQPDLGRRRSHSHQMIDSCADRTASRPASTSLATLSLDACQGGSRGPRQHARHVWAAAPRREGTPLALASHQRDHRQRPRGDVPPSPGRLPIRPVGLRQPGRVRRMLTGAPLRFEPHHSRSGFQFMDGPLEPFRRAENSDHSSGWNTQEGDASPPIAWVRRIGGMGYERVRGRSVIGPDGGALVRTALATLLPSDGTHLAQDGW